MINEWHYFCDSGLICLTMCKLCLVNPCLRQSLIPHHSTVICREKAQGDSFRCLPCKSKTLHGSKGPFTSPGVKNTRLSHMPTPVLVRTHNRLHLLLPSLHHLQQLRHVKHGSALIPRQDFRPRRVRNARTLPKLTLPVS